MSRKELWAPWRSEYLAGARGAECILCSAAAADDAEARIVERGQRCFTLLNAYPYTSGHLMVVPYRHVADLDELTEDEALELMRLAQRAIGALRRRMSPDGFNIGMNLGEMAGAGIADHLHLHVVPRWGGDTNFMPVIAGTHVISQALDATRAALTDELAAG